MLHTKFHGNRLAGSGEEDFLKGFYHIWAWRPRRLHIKFGFDRISGFIGEDV